MEKQKKCGGGGLRFPSICTCSDRVLNQKSPQASSSSSSTVVINEKCPIHARRDDEYKDTTTRSMVLKNAIIPSKKLPRAEAIVPPSSSPLFVVNDRIFITDKKCYGKIVSDSNYYQSLRYDVQLEETEKHNTIMAIHSSRLISASSSSYASPRYIPSLASKVVGKNNPVSVDDVFISGKQGMKGLSQEKVDAMIKSYSKIIRLAYESPENMVTFHIRRSTLYVAISEFKKALEDATAAIEILSANGTAAVSSLAYFRKGVAEFGLEQYQDALESFKNAYQIDPSSQCIRHAFFHALSCSRL